MINNKRRHPNWLKVKLPSGEEYNRINKLLDSYGLNTVCKHAKCPNVAECYGNSTATFLVMGSRCTRNCTYCNIQNEKPGPLDPMEPDNIAKVISAIGLKYVVITSVTRDDLADGGASHFNKIVRALKSLNEEIKIELLIPDFKGDENSLKIVLDSQPHILGHNIETVNSLFPKVRPQGNYNRSLELLNRVKSHSPRITSKSGLMVGLGETTEELFKALEDLRANKVEVLTIGQYLQPGTEYVPVSKYYTPKEFEELKIAAMNMGFSYVESGPLVRSSYHAERALNG